jgi:hypothetical protein
MLHVLKVSVAAGLRFNLAVDSDAQLRTLAALAPVGRGSLRR